MRTHHLERHRFAGVGWLRAAVLGANDGIVSVASILLGVAAATSSRSQVAIAGVAAIVAGAMAMAAGEFVSVSSQRDVEGADVARERRELLTNPDAELLELQHIYERRGLDPALARQVAASLMDADALDAHLRDELGITSYARPVPSQAAVSSAISFTAGGTIPLVAALVTPSAARVPVVAAVALALLAGTGALAGRVGGARITRAAGRVLLGGGLAMAVTFAIGSLVGAAV